MGFDIRGLKPVSEEGKYFGRNVYGWLPLAEYINHIAPDIAAKCRYWDSNDEDGLNAEVAMALAERLQYEISTGHTERYARVFNSEEIIRPQERWPERLFCRIGVSIDDDAPYQLDERTGVHRVPARLRWVHHLVNERRNTIDGALQG